MSATRDLLLRRAGVAFVAPAFLARLLAGDGAAAVPLPADLGASTFAALHRGDLDLPPGATCYALWSGSPARSPRPTCCPDGNGCSVEP
jgi:hypothetical protein